MKIVFRKCLSENNRIKKEFKTSDDLEKTGYLRRQLGQSCSLMDVEIEVEADIRGYNYMEIEAFDGRKYFIRDIASTQGKLWIVTGHCDVLSSWSEDLLKCYGLVNSRELDNNLFIDDGHFYGDCRQIVALQHFTDIDYKTGKSQTRTVYRVDANGYSCLDGSIAQSGTTDSSPTDHSSQILIVGGPGAPSS